EPGQPIAEAAGVVLQGGEELTGHTPAPLGRYHVHPLELTGLVGVQVLDPAAADRVPVPVANEEGATGWRRLGRTGLGQSGSVQVDPAVDVGDLRTHRRGEHCTVALVDPGSAELDRRHHLSDSAITPGGL